MTLIRVDGQEMQTAASVLQASASEVADIGGGVQQGCGSCCLPAGVEEQVLAAAFGVESSLVQVSSDLQAQAQDLAQRGLVAANDSLPTAASAASGPGLSGGTALPSPGPGLTWSTDGGQPLYEPTLVNGVMTSPLDGGAMVMTSFNEGSDGVLDTTGLRGASPELEAMVAGILSGRGAPNGAGGGSLGNQIENNFWAHTLGLNATSTAMNTVADSGSLIGSVGETGLVLGGTW